MKDDSLPCMTMDILCCSIELFNLAKNEKYISQSTTSKNMTSSIFHFKKILFHFFLRVRFVFMTFYDIFFSYIRTFFFHKWKVTSNQKFTIGCDIITTWKNWCLYLTHVIIIWEFHERGKPQIHKFIDIFGLLLRCCDWFDLTQHN